MWSLDAEKASELARFLHDLNEVMDTHPSVDVDFCYGGVQVEGQMVGNLRNAGDGVAIEESV